MNSVDRYKDSCAVLKKAVKLNPRSFVSFHALGISFKNLRNTTAAIKCFTKSLKIKPNQVSTLNELGILHSHIGKNKDALKYFRKILAIQPNATMHRHISLVTDYTTDETHILELESLLSQKLNLKDEIELRYAYFKATTAQGKIDESYNNLTKSKNLRKAQSTYDIQNALQVFKEVQSFHLRDKYQSPVFSRVEPETPVNIFIIGMPRSGTTLIEQALCNHPKVFSGGELSFLGKRLYPKFLNPNINSIEFSKLGINGLYKSYLRLTTEFEANTDFFVDKMPTNFLWLGIIQNSFPKIKIINIKRDPMAVIWSNYKHYFSSKELGFSDSFDDIISYYQAYQNLMEFWRANLDQNIYDLDYENFTKNPEAELKKLLQFCELNWEDSCLTFNKTETLIQTASRDQVRKPIYQGSSNEWKKYLKYLAPILKKAQSAGLIK